MDKKHKRSRRLHKSRTIALRRKKEALRLGFWENENPPNTFYMKRRISGHNKACFLCHGEKYFKVLTHRDKKRMIIDE